MDSKELHRKLFLMLGKLIKKTRKIAIKMILKNYFIVFYQITLTNRISLDKGFKKH